MLVPAKIFAKAGKYLVIGFAFCVATPSSALLLNLTEDNNINTMIQILKKYIDLLNGPQTGYSVFAYLNVKLRYLP